MDGRDLRNLRERLGLKQSEMAKAMGLSERSYQTFESGNKQPKTRHRDAAWVAALMIADQRQDPSLVPEDLFLLMRRLVEEAKRAEARRKRRTVLGARGEEEGETAPTPLEDAGKPASQ